jgi:glycosyltransferase involved in cell wall biosynthesis
MSRPPLLIIGPTPPPYHGVGVAVEQLLRSRLQEAFEVSHLELADRRGIGHVNKPDFHDVCLFGRQWFRFVWKMISHRPQVVYLVLSQTTVGFMRDSLFIWPAWLFGSRIVTHLHGGAFREWYDSGNRPIRAYVRFVLGTVTRMIVLGESLRAIFSGLLPDERIVVVPNGTEVRDESPERELPNGTRPWRILHLNTLNRMKGTLVFLEALPIILRHRKDVAFMFAGPWSHPVHQQEAERYIVEHRLEPYITSLGEVTGHQKEACLRSADLFVFPGIQQEGQPLVVLEAMAHGLPIVFTDRGCLRETIVAGESGVEALSNDPHDLALKILGLLAAPQEQQRLGKNALRRCGDLYSRDRYVERMIEVFKRSLTTELAVSNSPPRQATQLP